MNDGGFFRAPSNGDGAPDLPPLTLSLHPPRGSFESPRVPTTHKGMASALRAAKNPQSRAENRALLPHNAIAPILNMLKMWVLENSMRDISSQRRPHPAPLWLLAVVCNILYLSFRLVGHRVTLSFRWEIPLDP